MQYHWTDTPDALEGVNGIELAGVKLLISDDGDDSCQRVTPWSSGETEGERVDDCDSADFWSVYVHRDGEGSMAFADRPTRAAVRELGRELSERLGVPLYDYAGGE